MPFKKGYIPWNKGLDWQPKNGFKKGCASFNKGKTFSLETRRKMSEIAKGRIFSLETRRKLSEAVKGNKSYSWKGGVTPESKIQRNKFRQTILTQVLERDNYTCQICGKRGVNLHVDHIQPWAEYVEGRFDMNNCRTLCVSCHYEVTWKRPLPDSMKTWGHNLKWKEVN